MSDPSLMRATSVMAAGTLASRVLGFVRASMLAGLLGINGALAADTFATANTLPNQIYNLIAGGLLNAVLVPQITRAAAHEDGGQAFLDRLLTIALIGLAAVTVVVVALAPLVVLLRPYGKAPWDETTQQLCIAFAVWCLPQVFFYGLYTVLGQVLNARGRYGAYMWAPVVNNVVAIAGLAYLLITIGAATRGDPHAPATWTSGRIAVLAGTATLGVAIQAVVLLVPLRRLGFRYRPRFGFRGVGLGSAGRVAGWTFAAALVGQLAFLVTVKAVNTGGSGGGPGQNAYGNAFLLFMLPHSLVTVSLVTALFTRMSRSAASDDVPAVRRDLSVGLRLTGVATVLAIVAMLALGTDLTRTLFPGNSVAETRAVAWAATVMMVGLVSFSAQYLFQRVFYAFEDARTPFLVQLPVVATIAGGSYLSGRVLDPGHVVIGIGAGMALGYTIGAVLSVVLLRRRLGSLDGGRVLRTYVRLGCAAVPAALLGWGVSRAVHAGLGTGYPAYALALVAGGTVLLVSYVGGCKVLHVTELDEVAGPVLRRLSPRR